ncbi:MAG: hypothetical protein QOE74_2603 [Mycobacterium sp.]|jgi:threonine dehydrogenase-like Zn-dependent dehydrogenase|nr:hypothetical protein [Mycobacterium sp.]
MTSNGFPPANIAANASIGVIVKVVRTNTCGSDQHMVRGRTTVP